MKTSSIDRSCVKSPSFKMHICTKEYGEAWGKVVLAVHSARVSGHLPEVNPLIDQIIQLKTGEPVIFFVREVPRDIFEACVRKASGQVEPCATTAKGLPIANLFDAALTVLKTKFST